MMLDAKSMDSVKSECAQSDDPLLSLKLSKARRQSHLRSRFQVFVRAIGRLMKIWRDIQLYGSSRNQYAEEIAWKECFQKDSPDSKYLFSINSCFTKCWSIVIVFLLLWTATVMPFRICFEDDITTEWFAIELTVDILFLIDIFVTMNSAYVNEDQKLVNNRRIIMKNYLSGWFSLDLIACIPFQLMVSEDEDASYNKLIRLMRIPRLYRLIRIFRLFKLIRLFRSQAFFNKIINKLKVTTGILRLIKFSFSVILMIHIVGCFWYYLAKLEDFHYTTWVFRHDLIGESNGKLYLASIYWVIQTLTTVGFGDILAVTTTERIFALLVMGIGVGFYSYTVSNLSNLMAALDTRTSILKKRLNTLNEFCKETKINEKLKTQIKDYIVNNHNNNVYSWFDKDTLLKELPASLCREVCFHMHKNLVNKITFFQDKDPQFISFVVPKLKNSIAHFEESLFRPGEIATELYFLIKGEVNLVTESKVPFKTYASRSYFGEVDILFNLFRSYGAIVTTNKVRLLVLTKRDFFTLMHEFPSIANEIKQTAKLRKSRYEKSMVFAEGLHSPLRHIKDIKFLAMSPKNSRKYSNSSTYQENTSSGIKAVLESVIDSHMHLEYVMQNTNQIFEKIEKNNEIMNSQICKILGK